MVRVEIRLSFLRRYKPTYCTYYTIIAATLITLTKWRIFLCLCKICHKHRKSFFVFLFWLVQTKNLSLTQLYDIVKKAVRTTLAGIGSLLKLLRTKTLRSVENLNSALTFLLYFYIKIDSYLFVCLCTL